jgi:hypothetical protein
LLSLTARYPVSTAARPEISCSRGSFTEQICWPAPGAGVAAAPDRTARGPTEAAGGTAAAAVPPTDTATTPHTVATTSPTRRIGQI